MRAHGRLRGRHQGSESRWEAIRALSSRPFCPFDSRRVSLGYLSAGLRYTTKFWVVYLSPAANLTGPVRSRQQHESQTIMTSSTGVSEPRAARVPYLEAHLTYSLHDHPTYLPLTALVAAATVGPGTVAPRAASTPDRSGPRAVAGRAAAPIGKTNGLVAPPPRERPGARRRAAQRGLDRRCRMG